MVSSHARRGWALGESCRLFKNIFFCIFEASGINFTHRFRGLRQYSCHMADLNGFCWGGGLLGRGHRTNIWRGPTFLMSLKVTNTFLTDFSIMGQKTPPPQPNNCFTTSFHVFRQNNGHKCSRSVLTINENYDFLEENDVKQFFSLGGGVFEAISRIFVLTAFVRLNDI